MAIKNTNLGGTDWTSVDYGNATDLNDTFDAAYELVASNPAFWLNSNTYDVYDDFESETIGSFTTNTNWTISGTADISGGKELRLGTNSPGSHYAETKLLAVDKHKFFKIWFGGSTGGGSANGSISTSVTMGTSSGTILNASAEDNIAITNASTMILVVALGSNQYDVYVGGVKVITSVTAVDPQVRVTITYTGVGNSDTYYIYIDDVRESKYTIS